MDSLLEMRLGHASRLLIDTTQSIAEVAYNCGFNNISNFNRLFKKKKGCTPKEFRENYSYGSRVFIWSSITPVQKNPTSFGDGMNGGYFLLWWFFRPTYLFQSLPTGEVRRGLTTTSLVATVQTFITSAATHHDMTTNIAGRRITLHIFCSCIYRVHSTICFFILNSQLSF